MKFKAFSLIKLYSATFRDYLLHAPFSVSSERSTNIGKNDNGREKIEKKEKKIKKVEMSESRVRKFHKLFNQKIPDDEKLINYFSCALVADILLQGHIFISENYFSFYSNVFGYVTKLVIPISSVTFLTKEKTAKMFPNAIGVQVADDKHVFGSFLSREIAFQLMQSMLKTTQLPTHENDDEKEEDAMDFIEGVTESSKEDSSSLSSDSPAQFQIPDIALVASTPTEEVVKPIQHHYKVVEEVVAAEMEVDGKPSSTLLIIGIVLTLILASFSAFLLIRINSIENRKFISSVHRDTSQMSIEEAEGVLSRNIMTVINVRQKLEELQKVLEKSFNGGGGGSSREEL